ncbi:MAG: 6-phosphofructokinase [Patescibacteria group bacterium]
MPANFSPSLSMVNPEASDHTPKHYGLFTSGGGAPGLNGVIYGAVKEILRHGDIPHGIQNGWDGFLDQRPLIELASFSRARLQGLLRKRSSILGNCRTKIKTDEQREHVRKAIEAFQLDGVIGIGGDDTLGQLHQMWEEGIIKNANGVPKTIDNNVKGTERTFGFLTACHETAKHVEDIRADAKTLRRVAAVEIMGRDEGWIALEGGYQGGADITLIPEFQIEEAKLRAQIEKIYAEQGYVVIAIAEGYNAEAGERDDFGNVMKKDAGKKLLAWVKGFMNEGIKSKTEEVGTTLHLCGYKVRSCQPITTDAVFAAELGALAGKLTSEGKYGRLSALRNGLIVDVPLSEAGPGRKVTILHYDPEEMMKRDLPPNIVYSQLHCRGDLGRILAGLEDPIMPGA